VANECPNCQTKNPDESKFCMECATPMPGIKEAVPTVTIETSTEELTTGSIFAGRYKVIEELGKGGMGRVYKVLDKETNEKIALKLIKPEIASDKKTIERFRNELTTARKIGHRNVCRMYDLNKEKDDYYITMEYVSGGDLKRFIRRSKRLDTGTAISIAKQICDGLGEAHSLGVVHRDLKPNNIMLDELGIVRIMDFGIARTIKGKGITGAGVMIGTPEYMSPEQVEGKEVDQRSDLYSLGIILYEMVTGTLPFEGDTPFTIGVKHKSEIPKNPKELNPQIPGDLSRVILKCLEKDKNNRYQSAGEVLSDLERIEHGLPTTERKAAQRKPLTSREITVQFNLKKLALPGLAVFVLAAAAVLFIIFSPHKKEPGAPVIENSIAVISFKNQTGDPAFDYLQEVIPNLLITNLENSGLFYVATWERMLDILKQMGVKQAEVIDSGLGFELCRRAGIQAIAIGTFSKAGEIFIMDVKVLDAETKKTLKSANTKGQGADSIFDSQIDVLSREISFGLGAGMETVEAAQLNIQGITTHSLEAYRYFLKGKEGCNMASWAEARKNLEKALEIDPAFTMAYVYLVWTYFEAGLEKTLEETIEKAKELSDRSSQKDGFYLDGLYAYYIEKDTVKAVKHLDELIRKYPDEKWALHISGDFLRMDGDHEGALARYQKWLALDPQDANALWHLSAVSLAMGDFSKAEEFIKAHEALAPREMEYLNRQATIYRSMGQLENALGKYKEAHEVRPDSIVPLSRLVFGYCLKEEYEEAMNWADQSVSLAKSPEQKSLALLDRAEIYFLRGALDRALADITLAVDTVQATISLDKARAYEGQGFVHLARGEYEASRKSFENMLAALFEYDAKTPPTDRAEWAFDTGMLALEQGQVGQAKARLSEIRNLLPEIVKEQVQPYELRSDLLEGEIMLAQGALDEALSAAKRACGPGSPNWKRGGILYAYQSFYMDLAARIYAKKGEIDQAISAYEHLLKANYSKGFQFTINPLYHYRLGLLYEEANAAAMARAEYEKFLAFWKDADPGLPEVDDAKTRLAELKN